MSGQFWMIKPTLFLPISRSRSNAAIRHQQVSVVGGNGNAAWGDATQVVTAQLPPRLLVHLGGVDAVEPHR